MKKIIITLFILFSCGIISAQSTSLLYGDFNNDGKITIEDVIHLVNIALEKEQPKEAIIVDGKISIVDYDPYNGHEYVDLGLPSGTLWATCNIGAEKPEEYGDYFAWGEVEPKTEFTTENYKYGTPNLMSTGALFLYKYCSDSNFGDVDNLKELNSEDDAASQKWGGQWRMPTVIEQDELRDYCVWSKETLNGINGYRIVGPNGNSIFLPNAGWINSSGICFQGERFGYNSSHLCRYGEKDDKDDSVIILSQHNDKCAVCSTGGRYIGLPVRPVLGVKTNSVDTLEAIDLGLSVKWANMNVSSDKVEKLGMMYAWGEVSAKENFTWDNYKYGNKNYVTKYCLNSNYGDYDEKTILDPEDDAATVNLGTDWRIPTESEMRELFTSCSWIETSYNTYPGYRFFGANGNSVFFPCQLSSNGHMDYSFSPAFYQTSSLYQSNGGQCYNIFGWIIKTDIINKTYLPITTFGERSSGCYVRAVCN